MCSPLFVRSWECIREILYATRGPLDSPSLDDEGGVLVICYVTWEHMEWVHVTSRAQYSKALAIPVHQIIYSVLTKEREQKHGMFNLDLALDHENF